MQPRAVLYQVRSVRIRDNPSQKCNHSKEASLSKALSVWHVHHHIHGAFQLVLAVGEVDDKEEKEDESKGGPDAELGVLRQPERALARLPRRVLRVLKQQGSDVLELGAQI